MTSSIPSKEYRIQVGKEGREKPVCWAIVDKEDFERLPKTGWHLTNGYATRWAPVRTHHTTILIMHRIIMGAEKGQEVDHIDRDRLNNRKSNLRFVTRSQNHYNKGPRKGTSKYKGVSLYKASGKWRAQIKKQRKLYLLGDFENEVEAAKAYNVAAKELHGEYAYQNPL